MVYREAPICEKCGMDIQGMYRQPHVVFAGDTFIGWDYAGHICRLGTKHFIERTDTNLWWQGHGVWTSSPTAAMIWDTKVEAEEYLKMSLDIPPRLDCIVTEHEFIATDRLPRTALGASGVKY
jgi:hypothetical protein